MNKITEIFLDEKKSLKINVVLIDANHCKYKILKKLKVLELL